MMKIAGLAYVVAETTDLNRWKNYAEGVLGMMTAPSPDGGLYVRMDERQFRMAVEPGARDAYLASGWEVGSAQDFDAALLIDVENRPGVLAQVAAAVAKSQSNIERVEYLERDINVAVLRFSIQVRDRNHLAEVMRRLRRLSVVQSVRRQ